MQSLFVGLIVVLENGGHIQELDTIFREHVSVNLTNLRTSRDCRFASVNEARDVANNDLAGEFL